MRLFSVDSKVYQWLLKISQMMWMGILWLVCCVPVITAGASTTAVYRMMFQLRRDGNCSTKAFFRCFKENFKPATLLFLVRLAAMAVAVGLYFLCSITQNEIGKMVCILPALVLLMVWLMTGAYTYGLCACFENSLLQTVKSGFGLAMDNRSCTMLAIVLTMLPLTLLFLSGLLFLVLAPALLLIYPGLAFYVASGKLAPAFAPYAPEELRETK